MWVSTLSQIKKRDGRIVPFDPTKIVQAIVKAAQAAHGHDDRLAQGIAESVIQAVGADARETIPTVESIQDMIEKVLISQGHARTAKAFILYRAHRSRVREGKSELMESVADILQSESPSHGAGVHAPKLTTVGAAASREFYLNRVMREADATAHLEGDWHVHGLAHYATAPHGVALSYRSLLESGFRVGHAQVARPRLAHEAATATSVLVQAALADCHGAVAIADLDAAWAAVLDATTDDTSLDAAMGSLLIALNALPTQALGQLGAVSVHLGLDATDLGCRVTAALLRAIDAQRPLRPHLVFRVARGVNLESGTPNHDQLVAATELASRWPGLTFVHDAPGVAYLGHEARLEGPEDVLESRLTLNVPRVVLQARRDDLTIGQALDEALTAAAAQLAHRHEALSRRPAGDFTLLASGRPATEAIGPVLRRGHVAIGLVGLAEALTAIDGRPHGTPGATHAEAVALVERLAARCATLSGDLDLDIRLHAAVEEESAVRFARQDRRRFGMIRGVTETPAYRDGVSAAVGATLIDRLAAEGAFVSHLAGGAVFSWQAAEAPTAEAIREALGQAIASGHRAFAVSYPSATPDGTALVRRRGYLSPEA